VLDDPWYRFGGLLGCLTNTEKKIIKNPQKKREKKKYINKNPAMMKKSKKFSKIQI